MKTNYTTSLQREMGGGLETGGTYYQPLFDILNRQYGLLPIESEMMDIVEAVKSLEKETEETPQTAGNVLSEKWYCSNCGKWGMTSVICENCGGSSFKKESVKEDALPVSTEALRKVFDAGMARQYYNDNKYQNGSFAPDFDKFIESLPPQPLSTNTVESAGQYREKYFTKDEIFSLSNIGLRESVAEFAEMYAQQFQTQQPSLPVVTDKDLEREANDILTCYIAMFNAGAKKENIYVLHDWLRKILVQAMCKFAARAIEIKELSTPTVLTDDALQAEIEKLFPLHIKIGSKDFQKAEGYRIARKMSLPIDKRKIAEDAWDACVNQINERWEY